MLLGVSLVLGIFVAAEIFANGNLRDINRNKNYNTYLGGFFRYIKKLLSFEKYRINLQKEIARSVLYVYIAYIPC